MARSAAAAAIGVATCLTALAFCAANAQAPAPSASGQPDSGHVEGLARTLSDGVSCTGNPRDALDERGRKSGATAGDIGAALAIVSSSSDVCAPVRAAASALGADMISQQMASIQTADPADPASTAAAAARASLANAALEAEIRAASTRFENGPPPRNLTRGRITGS
jgi:hypothetical protein